jgi:iron-sulfur cluster assembly accessory protein
MDNITVTERAARRIGEILRHEPSGTMLRLSVEGGGCSGFQYKFDTDSAQEADDTVVRRADALLLIDPVSLGYLAGSEIDFVDDLIGASFRVNSPNRPTEHRGSECLGAGAARAGAKPPILRPPLRDAGAPRAPPPAAARGGA